MFIKVIRFYEKATAALGMSAGMGTGFSGMVIPCMVVLALMAVLAGFWTYVEVSK